MRVLLMASGLPLRGAERNVVSVLPHIRAQGVDIHLGTLNTRRDGPLAEEFARTGLPRHDLGARRLLDRAAWRRFVALLRTENFDLIHAEDQDTILFAAAAHRRLGMPTVMTRHVLVELAPNLKKWVRAQAVLLAARYGFDRIVAVSEAVRQDFARLAKVPLTRIETIYNGLDMAPFLVERDRAALRAALGWGEAPVVLLIAALRERKGHDVLFQAIPALRAAVPEVQIKLVGDGKLAAQIRAEAEPYHDVVAFMGERTDVPELLAACDAVVQSSWSEALPTVLIEAGASARPVVATDVGGSAEIVVDGETGFLVPAGDAALIAQRLALLLQDRDLAARLGAQARQRVLSRFSLEEQARQTVALYKRVLAEQQAKGNHRQGHSP